MKKNIAAGLAMIPLLFMATSFASIAGTASDSVISRSFLEGTYALSLRSEISGVFGEAASKSMGRADELFATYTGFRFVPRFTRITLEPWDTVVLSAGASFILRSGAATLTSVRGTVVNISTGSIVAAGERLSPNQRFFCVESTTAVITSNTSVIGQVDGYFHSSGGLLHWPHPVFSDVMEDDWYHSAVNYVYTHDFFSGTSPNTFSPASEMTRGMLVLVLYRLDGNPSVEIGARFSDVSSQSPYHSAVNWANTNNIVRGYGSGLFGPNDPVTREQLATFIFRYAEYKHGNIAGSDTALNAFPDAGDVSGYAVEAMRWAVSQGVINGSGGMLLPLDTATRAQTAQVISNYTR